MPKGGKNRRRGKNENEGDKRELVFKEEGQEYAQVIKMLGNGRVWINQGDIVLLSLRDFQDGKADVIQKYSSDEARKLKQYGELPETAKINETDVYGGEDGDDMVDFGEVSGEDEGPLNGAVPESDSDESIGGGKDDFDIDDI
ncbi:eukaryotic translation initiation factor eIF-1A [Rhodotorula sp. JG-1b]|nr:eukaryotic translation initiation factor eIF-1A [Rhodotorula sp. JG-1b]